MDPVDTKDPLTAEMRTRMEALTGTVEGVIGIHDLRIVKGYVYTNIVFDVVLSPKCKTSKEAVAALIDADIKSIDPNYFAVVNFDMDYSGH
jgi:divalent metal cation (Fe/Co/Zn/Cd) transporter